MKIKADSYITNIVVYRLSNLSYGIGILSSLILSVYYLTIENGNENKAIYIILSLIIMLSLIIGRIATVAAEVCKRPLFSVVGTR